MGSEEWIILGRVSGALLVGALIGFERSFHGRPAGFRTHALVCLASSLLMLVTVYQNEWMTAVPLDAIRTDPTRMAQGIMTGIGFLGAGVIFKEGLTVRGLTTAASISVTAAMRDSTWVASTTRAILGSCGDASQMLDSSSVLSKSGCPVRVLCPPYLEIRHGLCDAGARAAGPDLAPMASPSPTCHIALARTARYSSIEWSSAVVTAKMRKSWLIIFAVCLTLSSSGLLPLATNAMLPLAASGSKVPGHDYGSEAVPRQARDRLVTWAGSGNPDASIQIGICTPLLPSPKLHVPPWAFCAKDANFKTRLTNLAILIDDFYNKIGTHGRFRQSANMSAIEGRPAVPSRSTDLLD